MQLLLVCRPLYIEQGALLSCVASGEKEERLGIGVTGSGLEGPYYWYQFIRVDVPLLVLYMLSVTLASQHTAVNALIPDLQEQTKNEP
jgi:hypothetical protein